jgi:hypothetical protein
MLISCRSFGKNLSFHLFLTPVGYRARVEVGRGS